MKPEAARQVIEGMKDAGINFVSSVPSSSLTVLLRLIDESDFITHVKASNESDAVSICAGVASKSGIPNTFTVTDAAGFQKAIDAAYQAKGASYIVAKTNKDRISLPNAPFEGVENKYRFVRYVEQAENIKIVKPPAVKQSARRKAKS